MKFKNLLVVSFCLLLTMSFSQLKSLAKLKEGLTEEEAVNPHEIARQAYFAGRPETPSADILAPKENIIPKGESFEAKIARYKADGFVIAIAFYSEPIMTKVVPAPGTGSSTISQRSLNGSLPSMESDLRILAEEFTKRMNEEFATDLFKLVDMNTIPTKKVLGLDVDDWEPTKYKMVFSYVVSPGYDYSMSKYNGDFVATASVSAVEYNSKKGKMSIVVGGKTIANSRLNYSDESLKELKTVEQLHDIVNPPS